MCSPGLGVGGTRTRCRRHAASNLRKWKLGVPGGAPLAHGVRERALRGRRRAESLLAPPVASVAGNVGHHSRTAPFHNKQHTSTGKPRQRNSRKHEVRADTPALRGGRSVEPHFGHRAPSMGQCRGPKTSGHECTLLLARSFPRQHRPAS